MNRRYLATLVGVAVLILFVGLLIKPHDALQGGVAHVAEAAPLQQLSQEGDLRDEAGYFTERIDAVADQVVFVEDTRASGVVWTGGNTVVSARPAGTAGVLVTPLPATRASASPGTLPDRPSWLVVVARLAGERIVSTAGLTGGIISTRCGGEAYDEIVLSAPLHEVFAGAGLFDLNGRRIGMVIRCGGRLVATTAAQIDRLIASTGSVSGQLRAAFGLVVQPAAGAIADGFRADSGVIVLSVENSFAERWKIDVGDNIVGLNGRPVTSAAELGPLLVPSGDSGHVVTVVRNGSVRSLTLAVDAAASAGGVDAGGDLPLSVRAIRGGVLLESLGIRSAAYRAGLRNGDVLLRINDRNATVAAARDALEQQNTVPVRFVILRGSVRRALLVPAQDPR